MKYILQFISMVQSRRLESNQRPTDYKSVALPTELLRLIYLKNYFQKKQLLYRTTIFGMAKVSIFD